MGLIVGQDTIFFRKSNNLQGPAIKKLNKPQEYREQVSDRVICTMFLLLSLVEIWQKIFFAK